MFECFSILRTDLTVGKYEVKFTVCVCVRERDHATTMVLCPEHGFTIVHLHKTNSLKQR